MSTFGSLCMIFQKDLFHQSLGIVMMRQSCVTAKK